MTSAAACAEDAFVASKLKIQTNEFLKKLQECFLIFTISFVKINLQASVSFFDFTVFMVYMAAQSDLLNATNISIEGFFL